MDTPDRPSYEAVVNTAGFDVFADRTPVTIHISADWADGVDIDIVSAKTALGVAYARMTAELDRRLR